MLKTLSNNGILADHRKWPEFKTVLAKTIPCNWVQKDIMSIHFRRKKALMMYIKSMELTLLWFSMGFRLMLFWFSTDEDYMSNVFQYL